MREVSLETLSNVNRRDPSHDKNLPIMPVTGSINQNEFKDYHLYLPPPPCTIQFNEITKLRISTQSIYKASFNPTFQVYKIFIVTYNKKFKKKIKE